MIKCLNLKYKSVIFLFRLGKSGVEEIMKHPFFANDQWDFNSIRDCVPPVVPDLTSDDDTSHFEVRMLSFEELYAEHWSRKSQDLYECCP